MWFGFFFYVGLGLGTAIALFDMSPKDLAWAPILIAYDMVKDLLTTFTIKTLMKCSGGKKKIKRKDGDA